MISNLDLCKQNFIKNASGLKNYEKMSETELINGCCDAHDKGDLNLEGQYYSALMLRYWYKIYKYKETCKSTRLEDIDYINWLIDALNIAMKYRDWRNPEKPIYGDPKAVDKIINRCCFSIRGYYYQEFNKDKRKINYITDSIEGQLEVFGESAEANLGVEDVKDDLIESLISTFIKEDKIEEAIIVDNICYQDTFKEENHFYYVEEQSIKYNEDKDLDFDEENKLEETTKTTKKKYNYITSSFSKRKLKKELSNLDNDYYIYFNNQYDNVSLERLEKAKIFYSNLKDKGLYSFIDKTLNLLKEELKEFM